MGDLFEIDNTLSFNTDVLTEGEEYDYVTRTSRNQGILRNTGFVNLSNINPAGNWSLGLLQMDFFYRRKPWYAGQFVRKVIPKFEIKDKCILFFSTLLNTQKPALLQVLVRHVDETFRNLKVNIPVQPSGKIDFEFIESFIAELQAQRIAELQAYLTATGLKDYTLTDEECKVLENYKDLEFTGFSIPKIFDVRNTGNILSEEIVENSGTTPYLCASSDNNAVSSYISYNENRIDSGNCIFIGGKTFEVTYQEKDFYSNDSHNLILRLLDDKQRTKNVHLYLATCVRKSLKHKYSWGNSVSSTKIKKDVVSLPAHNGKVNYNLMEILISAIQKLVIKDVVLYADQNIKVTKNIINQSPYKFEGNSDYPLAADSEEHYGYYNDASPKQRYKDNDTHID